MSDIQRSDIVCPISYFKRLWRRLEHRDVCVRVDADFAGDRECLLHDVARGQGGFAKQRACGRLGIGAAGTDREHAVIGFDSSPLPEIMNPCSASATTSSASRRRRIRSLRHSFASSTAARGRLPGKRSSFSSNFSKSVSASAADPAKPASTRPPLSARTFTAWALATVSPTETCPSPPIAILPSRRTARIVVARI